MGNVSTALPEEALSECLKRNSYHMSPSDKAAESCNENKDDIKCSICQVFFSEFSFESSQFFLSSCIGLLSNTNIDQKAH